jgi:phosphoglycolate phosphatase
MVASCVAQMRAEYARRWHAKTRPYPGIPQLLDTLTAHGLRLAILSNKPHDFTVRIAERLLARWSFDPVLGARAGVPKKPDPGAALEIAGQRGIPPGAWLYLGDTSTDMETATAAGMFPVGVLWGFRGAAELEASGARLLIQRPDQLLELL